MRERKRILIFTKSHPNFQRESRGVEEHSISSLSSGARRATQLDRTDQLLEAAVAARHGSVELHSIHRSSGRYQNTLLPLNSLSRNLGGSLQKSKFLFLSLTVWLSICVGGISGGCWNGEWMARLLQSGKWSQLQWKREMGGYCCVYGLWRER